MNSYILVNLLVTLPWSNTMNTLADHGDVLDDLFEEGRRPRPLSGGHPGEAHHHRSRQPLPRPPAADQLDEEESEGKDWT